MGNVIGDQTKKEAEDIQKKQILKLRNRSINERLKLDEEADSTDTLTVVEFNATIFNRHIVLLYVITNDELTSKILNVKFGRCITAFNTSINRGSGICVDPEFRAFRDADKKYMYQSQSIAEDYALFLSEIDLLAMKIDPKDHTYPIENLVFEGNGSKGLASCGAVRALEEIGLIDQVKRFAGASAGAICAAVMAVGYGSEDNKRFLGQNMSKMCLYARFGVLSLLPNRLDGYGWNPGIKMYNWIGEVIEKKIRNRDITFAEVFHQKILAF